MEKFINQQSTTNKQHDDQFKQLHAIIDQLVSHNQILENQIVQQASSTPQPLGKLPSQPEYYPKESCQVINLRSGKEVGSASSSKKKVISEDDDEGVADTKVDDSVRDNKDDSCGVKVNNSQEGLSKKDEHKIDLQTLPFPQRFIRCNLDKQFGKFLDHMKDITITIPFLEVIRDIPS